jgi:hypothetical protein
MALVWFESKFQISIRLLTDSAAQLTTSLSPKVLQCAPQVHQLLVATPFSHSLRSVHVVGTSQPESQQCVTSLWVVAAVVDPITVVAAVLVGIRRGHPYR